MRTRSSAQLSGQKRRRGARNGQGAQTCTESDAGTACEDTEMDTDTDYYYDEDEYLTITDDNMEDILKQIMAGNTLEVPNIRDKDLFRMLRRLGQRWLPADVKNAAEFGEWAHTMFNVDPESPEVSFEMVQRVYEIHLFQMQRLLYYFVDNDAIQKNDPEFMDVGIPMMFISKLHEILTMARDYLFSEHRIMSIWGNHTEINVPPEVEIFRFSGADMESLNEYQSLLFYLMNVLRAKGYRKKGENCYHQKIINYNGKRYGTRAWEYKETIKEFIHRNVNKATNFKQWKNMTASHNAVVNAATYLMNSSDTEFPFLNVSRHLHAFQNGIYYTKDNTFIPYSSMDEYTHILENKDCCKFHNYMFESKRWITNLKGEHWFDIPTPAIEKILIYQGHGEEVRRWVYAFFGRLLYEVSEMDNWQCVLFIKGPGGTGKSSLGKAVRNFYKPEDVADLSNNIEKKFGLSAIFDKYMFLCLEAKENFNLEQTEFQSMVSGEGVSIAIKNKTAVSRVWTVPGMLCGNVLPRWVDPGGAISRRVVLLGFENFVVESDPMLPERLVEEAAAFLCKCNRAYLYHCNEYKDKNIWDALPEYFQQQQQELIESSNQLVHFLKNSAEIEVAEDLYMLEDDFINFLNKYMKEKYLGHFIWKPEYFGHVFAQKSIKLEKSVRMYNGQEVFANWVVGVGERANSKNKLYANAAVQMNNMPRIPT